jgi:hypothetical protein
MSALRIEYRLGIEVGGTDVDRGDGRCCFAVDEARDEAEVVEPAAGQGLERPAVIRGVLVSGMAAISLGGRWGRPASGLPGLAPPGWRYLPAAGGATVEAEASGPSGQDSRREPDQRR